MEIRVNKNIKLSLEERHLFSKACLEAFPKSRHTPVPLSYFTEEDSLFKCGTSLKEKLLPLNKNSFTPILNTVRRAILALDSDKQAGRVGGGLYLSVAHTSSKVQFIRFMQISL